MASDNDEVNADDEYTSPILSVAISFRNVVKTGLNATQFRESDEVYSSVKIILMETNQGLEPGSLRLALRRAERQTTMGVRLADKMKTAISKHPDRLLTVQPLFDLAVEKAHVFKITPEGLALLKRYLWASFVSHGNPGARLPDPPDGIDDELTHVPSCRASDEDGGGGDGVSVGLGPAWAR